MLKTITQQQLKELLHYEPTTGVFVWLHSCGKSVAGKVAGSSENGYIRIGVNRRIYQAHRLAFLYMTGSFPQNQTDHINHIRHDNRFSNLREVTNQENGKNISMRCDNTSGRIGVYKRRGGYKAAIYIDGKDLHLGDFKTLEEAASARKEAEKKYGFHFNHGETACQN